MFDKFTHQKQHSTFLSEFEVIQDKMLDLDLKIAMSKFDEFYINIEKYLVGLLDKLDDVKKGDDDFLSKKQASLSLRNVKMLQKTNAELLNFNAAEIISHFEKQLVFKKILKRQISSFEKN